MALIPERYAEVDEELGKIDVYLVTLAAEIDREAPVTDKRRFTYQATRTTCDAIAHLRYMLADN